MVLAQVRGPEPAGPSVDARAARRALRAERAQLTHWRRLLRARLDLAVAGMAPPEHLGTFSWDLLPDAVLLLPRAQELHDVVGVGVGGTTDTVELMTRLRRLDRMLATYAGELDEALEAATEELLHGFAADDAPTAAATGLDGGQADLLS